MAKRIPVNMRKTLGVMLLSSVVAMGAFSLLRTSVTSTNSNIISAGGNDGTVQQLLVEMQNELNMLQKWNALPETLDQAKAKDTPYTFKLANTGTMKQVVRLTMNDVKAPTTDSITNELDHSKVKIYVTDGQDNKIFDGTLAEAEAGGANGFGGCFIVDKENAKDDYKLYAYIDDKSTNEDIFGSGGDESKGLEFKIGAIALQYDGVFTADGSDMNALTHEFETLANK